MAFSLAMFRRHGRHFRHSSSKPTIPGSACLGLNVKSPVRVNPALILLMHCMLQADATAHAAWVHIVQFLNACVFFEVFFVRRSAHFLSSHMCSFV